MMQIEDSQIEKNFYIHQLTKAIKESHQNLDQITKKSNDVSKQPDWNQMYESADNICQKFKNRLAFLNSIKKYYI